MAIRRRAYYKYLYLTGKLKEKPKHIIEEEIEEEIEDAEQI